MAMRFRRIDFACNGDGGYFSGRVKAIDYGGRLELEGRGTGFMGRGFVFKVEDGRVRIHRKWFTFTGCPRGGGNWYWEGFMFEIREAKRLLRHLKNSGHWSIDGGLVRLCDWFENRGV